MRKPRSTNEEPNHAATSGPTSWPFISKRTPRAEIVSVSSSARTIPAAAPHQRARSSLMSGDPRKSRAGLFRIPEPHRNAGWCGAAATRRGGGATPRVGRGPPARAAHLARSVEWGSAMDARTFHAQRRFAGTPSGRIAYVEQGRGPAAVFVHGEATLRVKGPSV